MQAGKGRSPIAPAPATGRTETRRNPTAADSRRSTQPTSAPLPRHCDRVGQTVAHWTDDSTTTTPAAPPTTPPLRDHGLDDAFKDNERPFGDPLPTPHPLFAHPTPGLRHRSLGKNRHGGRHPKTPEVAPTARRSRGHRSALLRSTGAGRSRPEGGDPVPSRVSGRAGLWTPPRRRLARRGVRPGSHGCGAADACLAVTPGRATMAFGLG